MDEGVIGSKPAVDSAVDLSWEDVARAAEVLSGLLAVRGPWRGIVAVSRGGLIPAALVSRSLGLRSVEAACLGSYEGRARSEVRVESVPARAGDGEGWIVLDDLADSGASARALRGFLPKAFFAALYAKPAGASSLDLHAESYPDDVWLSFPWESASPD